MLQPGDYIEDPSTNSLFEFMIYIHYVYEFKTVYSERYDLNAIWSIDKSHYFFKECDLPSKERVQYYKKLMVFK